jgi:hypothetical protein
MYASTASLVAALLPPVAAATASISFCSFMNGPLCSLSLSPDLISPPSRAHAVAWTYHGNWPYHERPRQQVCRCRGLSRRTPPATDPPLAACGQAANTHPSRSPGRDARLISNRPGTIVGAHVKGSVWSRQDLPHPKECNDGKFVYA